MRGRDLSILVSVVALLGLSVAAPVQAANLDWNGSLALEEYWQDAQIFHYNNLQLKMEINSGEGESGVVLMQLKAPVQDPSSAEPLPYLFELNQAYIDLFLTESALLRMGRQKISWGSGFCWNPTNYLGSGKNRAEFMIDNSGVDAVDAEFNWGNTLLVLAVKPQSNWHDTGKAVKIGELVAGCDLSLSGFQQGDDRGYGCNFVTSLGEFIIYSEVAAKAGSHYFYIENHTEMERPADRYYLHGVFGINRIFAGNLSVMLEYYYNQKGWNDQEAENFFNYLDSLTGDQIAALTERKSALLADLRRNYLFLTIRKAGLFDDDLTISGRVLWNIDDHSYQLTPVLQYDLRRNIYIALNANLNFGGERTEFGSLPYKTLINAKLGLNF